MLNLFQHLGRDTMYRFSFYQRKPAYYLGDKILKPLSRHLRGGQDDNSCCPMALLPYGLLLNYPNQLSRHFTLIFQHFEILEFLVLRGDLLSLYPPPKQVNYY